jgi:hypothetical protein
MDEAKTKSAGKKAARKTSAGKPTPRARKPAPIEPGFTASAAPALEAAPSGSHARISPEERHRLIAEAAYYRARQRGFTGGAEVEDWLAAEAEVDNKLLGR